MRTLPSQLLTEIQKEYFMLKHLFEFEWDQNYFFTDCDMAIYYDNKVYEPKGIKFDAISVSLNPQIDQVKIEINDVNKNITSLVLSNAIIDKPARIYLTALDNNLAVIGSPILLFMGYCDSASKAIGKKTVAIEIYNHMIKWKRITPRGTTSPLCLNEFKHGPTKIIGTDNNIYVCIQNHMGHPLNRPVTGANWSSYWQLSSGTGITWKEMDYYTVGTCRYTGAETWCDKSWERCKALNNTINYRGFRWLHGVQGQAVWWGSSADPTIRAYIAYKARGH